MKNVEKFGQNLPFQIWFNADILKGPVNASNEPVNPEIFLKLCNQYFPNATLSPGFTTCFSNNLTITTEQMKYSLGQMEEMTKTLKKHDCLSENRKVTFPLRAVFVSKYI